MSRSCGLRGILKWMTGRSALRFVLLLPLLALSLPGPPHAGPSSSKAAEPASSAVRPSEGSWIDVDYAALVDRRRLSHSGESVGVLLDRLQGRPVPAAGERPGDALAHVLLDPLLEPYAMVLADALDTMEPSPERPLVEVAGLFPPGGAEPAWVELLRSRRYLVESDGSGALRVCLPWEDETGAPGSESGSATPRTNAVTAARAAWDSAWPVLRHVLASERLRLAQAAGDAVAEHPLTVEVHAYRHLPALSRFTLGVGSYRVTVDDTRSRADRPPLDLEALRRFVERGLQLEGGRLDPTGTLLLLGSESPQPPGLLGRPLAASDFAVAYRAVFHGGASEPYMSLDRGFTPEHSLVNYGGRLRDTALGMVSLLCDIRFKTFSLGIDVAESTDVREAVRGGIPGFRTHLERFSDDSGSGSVMSQQTRLWFYPDEVDLTLSPEGDVLAMRRVRMTAASERILERGDARAGQPDPPWTAATISAINEDYTALARFFPEMSDLDQVVRLLSFFTWLRQAEAEGLLVPDLDALLAIELPPEPTPRRFPQLLTLDLLPGVGKTGTVDVFDRATVVEALDRLQPATGRPLPASRRLARALAALDRRQEDEGALATQIESSDNASLSDSERDLMTHSAERLIMHRLVLNTPPVDQVEQIAQRGGADPTIRLFRVGIGGLDLGMEQAVSRATRRSAKISFGGGAGRAGTVRTVAERVAGPGEATRGVAASAEGGSRSVTRPATAGAGSGAAAERMDDPRGLPVTPLPGHGTRPSASSGGGPSSTDGVIQATGTSPQASGTSAATGRPTPWSLTVLGPDGPEVRSRRLLLDAGRRARAIERVEDMRFLRYRLDPNGQALVARIIQGSVADGTAPSLVPVPSAAGAASSSITQIADPSPGLVILSLSPAAAPSSGEAEPATIGLRLRGLGGGQVRDLGATVPRGLLRRLVLGREVDLTPSLPLRGLSPLPTVFDAPSSLMALMDPGQTTPPWTGTIAGVPGEEDPVRLAGALGRWWSSEEGSGMPAAVVGTDPQFSPARWARAPMARGDAMLLLADDALPGGSASLREGLENAWSGGKIVGAIGSGELPSLIVLVSAESPDVLARRLRDVARLPGMEGKLLAVWSLGGRLRQDLPASLLAEGRLAGLGVAEGSPVGVQAPARELHGLRQALAGVAAGVRAERLPGSLLWYY